MIKINTDKEKILHFLDCKGILKNQFYVKTGLSIGFLDKGSSLGVDKLRIIVDNYPDFNPLWLLKDNQSMTLTNIGEPIEVYRTRTDRNYESQAIPLYDIQASAGLVELFNNSGSFIPIDTLKIPNLPKCDGALFVTGDSMYPLLKSGDIIAYKEIKDLKNDLFWGEMYIVSVEVGNEYYTSVKYIQKSDLGDTHIKLVSQNSHHQPKDVELIKVRAVAIVKASVRMNTMR